MSIKEILKILFAVLIGTLFYTLIWWVPIVGPLVVGLLMGWIAKTNAKRAFFIGVISGILGFLFWIFFVFPRVSLSPDSLIWWIFVIWNLLSVLLTGIGASFGSMISTTAKFFSDFRRFRTRDNEEGEERKNFYEPEAKIHTFILCPNCGISNSEESEYCSNCGAKLNK